MTAEQQAAAAVSGQANMIAQEKEACRIRALEFRSRMTRRMAEELKS